MVTRMHDRVVATVTRGMRSVEVAVGVCHLGLNSKRNQLVIAMLLN